ncbi:MAG: DUF1588 domain-containing protein [Myxococcales bacterium]|nr:DUF1588 domain-containing protein [Myxococcales bacterium]
MRVLPLPVLLCLCLACTASPDGMAPAGDAAPDRGWALDAGARDLGEPDADPDLAPTEDARPLPDAGPPADALAGDAQVDLAVPDAAAPDPTCAQVAHGPAQSLTPAQYRALVDHWLGVDASDLALPTVTGPPAELDLVRWLEAAQAVAARVDPATLALPCDLAEAGCGPQALAALAEVGFRRAPTADEQTWLAELWAAGPAAVPPAALRQAIAALLVSPQVLYRLSPPPQGAPTPLPRAALAERLAWGYVGAPPDPDWADLPLDRADDAAALAELLVDDPRFRRRVDAFFTAWLALDDLNTLAKADPLPPVTDALRAGLRAELLALAGHAVFQAGTLAALFESRATQLTPEVAALYGVAPDAAALPAAERAGLVTRAGLLALLAGPQFKSPIDRGAFIQRRLLCLDLPDPPPTVDNTPVAPDAQAAQTVRARTAQRTAGGACEGCHRLINPVGFTLEHYDGLGRFTATEAVGDQHLPIDATGAVPLSDIAGPVDGGLALSQALARSAQVRQCVARQWLGFFLDRPLTAADACSLAQLQAAFEASGGAWRTLFVETARLPAVRHRGGATP